MEYISEMFNCMTTVPEDKSLSGRSLLEDHVIINGEIEYILYGNASTATNKSIAYSSLLYAARLAIDMLYVFMDKEKNAAANATCRRSQQRFRAGMAVPDHQIRLSLLQRNYPGGTGHSQSDKHGQKHQCSSCLAG